MFAEAVDEVGLPPGVFQLVLGRADEIAARVAGEPHLPQDQLHRLDGSRPAADRRRGRGRIKKLSLELGGHAPLLVFADADLDQAVQGTIIAKFRNTGQSCIAANRVYVNAARTSGVRRAARQDPALKVGNGLEDGVEIGPLIDRRALDQALDHVARGGRRDARSLCGGRPWDGAGGGAGGYVSEPTILSTCPAAARRASARRPSPRCCPVCVFDEESGGRRRRQQHALRTGGLRLHPRSVAQVWRLAESLEAGTDRHQRFGAHHQPMSLRRRQGERLGTRVGQRGTRRLPRDQAHFVGGTGVRVQSLIHRHGVGGDVCIPVCYLKKNPEMNSTSAAQKGARLFSPRGRRFRRRRRG